MVIEGVKGNLHQSKCRHIGNFDAVDLEYPSNDLFSTAVSNKKLTLFCRNEVRMPADSSRKLDTTQDDNGIMDRQYTLSVVVKHWSNAALRALEIYITDANE